MTLRETLRELGWTGRVNVSTTEDGHVHVRWDGRHVEAVSAAAAAEFIRRDAAAKASALLPDTEVDDG